MSLFRFVFRSLFTRTPPPPPFSTPQTRRVRYQSRSFTVIEGSVAPPRPAPKPPEIIKSTCYVIDGDTIVLGKLRIRIAGIDAPELDHPWGQKSKWAMVQLCKGQVITAHVTEELSYDRIVATCYLPDGRDLAAELVKQGLAIDWPKYSGGKYRHLEPEGIRRKLWRAAARQNGRMPPS
ncbi:Endonuclease YncB, thermonuclease family [Roseovarius litoreus]|uniref:Endonuclease YncB, thermonuclease family n=1 Tax=Roseovarius litoreus TaxID=1155722 RepID=A0A1M7J431_9RHOB|nr:Endonuclease YncB, thermonuclease family [Roseovarius litoreus]